jgi:hypothetical protein
MVELAAAAAPAPPVGARGRQAAVLEAEREPVVDGDRPDARLGHAAHGDVAARTHETRPAEREQLGDALRGESLPDPAEVEPEPGLDCDPAAVEIDAPAATRL